MSNNVYDLKGIFQAQEDYLKYIGELPPTNPEGPQKTINAIQGNLDKLYTNFEKASGTSSAVLDHQTKINDIAQTELNRLQQKKTNVDLAIEGQKRMVKLNDSYRKKYSYYVKIMITTIVFLLIFIALNMMSNYFPIIPSLIFDILYFLLGTTLIFTIYFIFQDIVWRDNMNFDELSFNAPNITDPLLIAQQQNQASKMGNLLGTINVIGCVGNNCCDPNTAIWDAGNSVCKGISKFTGMSDIQIDAKANSPFEFGDYSVYN
jgi:hypothetical protein